MKYIVLLPIPLSNLNVTLEEVAHLGLNPVAHTLLEECLEIKCLCSKMGLFQKAQVVFYRCCSTLGSYKQEQTVTQQPFQVAIHSNTT